MSGLKPSPLLARARGLGWAVLRAVLSLLAGLAVALMLSYLLYRVGLPSKPFIYVSF
jgi:hypothetical protein